MKKFVMGLILGLLLSVGAVTYAEDIQSMIGKTIEGSFPLEINGQRAGNDVVVIEGTSYVPARAAGEMFGYEVSFIDSKVIMKPLEGVVNLDKLEQWKKEADEKRARMDKIKEENLTQIKAEEERAAKIRAEGDAEAAAVKEELNRKAQEAAQRQQQQQTQPQSSTK